MGEPTVLRILGQNVFDFQVSIGFSVDLHKLLGFEKSPPTKSQSMTGTAQRLQF